MDLVSINFVSAAAGEKRNSLTVEDTLAMKIVLNYNGPKVCRAAAVCWL